MSDRAQILEAVLDDDGKLTSIVVEQEDHTRHTLSVGTPGVGDFLSAVSSWDMSALSWSATILDGTVVTRNLGNSLFIDEDNADWGGPVITAKEAGRYALSAIARVALNPLEPETKIPFNMSLKSMGRPDGPRPWESFSSPSDTVAPIQGEFLSPQDLAGIEVLRALSATVICDENEMLSVNAALGNLTLTTSGLVSLSLSAIRLA